MNAAWSASSAFHILQEDKAELVSPKDKKSLSAQGLTKW